MDDTNKSKIKAMRSELKKWSDRATNCEKETRRMAEDLQKKKLEMDSLQASALHWAEVAKQCEDEIEAQRRSFEEEREANVGNLDEQTAARVKEAINEHMDQEFSEMNAYIQEIEDRIYAEAEKFKDTLIKAKETEVANYRNEINEANAAAEAAKREVDECYSKANDVYGNAAKAAGLFLQTRVPINCKWDFICDL